MNISLYAGASALRSAQTKVDAISNNLANTNTVGYKAERVMFQDLLYEHMNQSQRIDLEGRVTPLGYQYGHGVKVNEISRDMTVGNLQRTDNPYDIALTGEGLFQLLVPHHVADRLGVSPQANDNYDNDLYSYVFTRAGGFRIDVHEEGYSSLVDANGYQVSDIYGNPIEFDDDVDKFSIDSEGRLFINGETTPHTQLMVANFRNPQSLHHAGNSIFVERRYIEDNYLNSMENPEFFEGTKFAQGFVEQSNVNVIKEMTELIAAQRMLQFGARAIQSADTLMGLANTIRS